MAEYAFFIYPMSRASPGLQAGAAALGSGMAKMIDRWFAAHPRSVGESYPEHFAIAARFGLHMIAGGVVCLVHALVPALFERTGSATIKRLYADIVSRQPGQARPAHEDARWQPEYEI